MPFLKASENSWSDSFLRESATEVFCFKVYHCFVFLQEILTLNKSIGDIFYNNAYTLKRNQLILSSIVVCIKTVKGLLVGPLNCVKNGIIGFVQSSVL